MDLRDLRLGLTGSASAELGEPAVPAGGSGEVATLGGSGEVATVGDCAMAATLGDCASVRWSLRTPGGNLRIIGARAFNGS